MFVNLALAAATATLALTATPAQASPDRTPVCKYEDGSGQARCVWDARHNGNGHGRSYVIVNGGEDNAKIRFVTHRRAHWLATTAN